MSLTKDQILGASSLPRIVYINVDEWGGEVAIRRMSGIERDAWDEGWSTWRVGQNGDDKNFDFFHAYLARHSMCDESGELLFGDLEVRKLAAQPAAAILKVATASMKVNGIGAGEVEILEKNSSGGLKGSPGTDTQPSMDSQQ